MGIIPTAIPSDTESHCTIAGHLARTYHYLWYRPYYTPCHHDVDVGSGVGWTG